MWLTEACDKSIASKIRLIGGDTWMISPLIRQSCGEKGHVMHMLHTHRIWPAHWTYPVHISTKLMTTIDMWGSDGPHNMIWWARLGPRPLSSTHAPTFLLSSNTVFMLSIHSVSIGPSNTTHLRCGVSDDANSRKVLATIPSVHFNEKEKKHHSFHKTWNKISRKKLMKSTSWETWSNCPKSCPMVMDLGLRVLKMTFSSPPWPLSLIRVRVSASTWRTLVFPANGSPTSMNLKSK